MEVCSAAGTQFIARVCISQTEHYPVLWKQPPLWMLGVVGDTLPIWFCLCIYIQAESPLVNGAVSL